MWMKGGGVNFVYSNKQGEIECPERNHAKRSRTQGIAPLQWEYSDAPRDVPWSAQNRTPLSYKGNVALVSFKTSICSLFEVAWCDLNGKNK